MPTCSRPGLDKKAAPVDRFRDDEKVFFCELTKEIFRDYEEYFERVMLLNSTIWSCSETGKQNLTYAEALKSERRARKTGEILSEQLKAVALMLVATQNQTSNKLLISKIFGFVKDRFFLDEEIKVTKTKSHYVGCKVIEIIPPKDKPSDGVYDPKSVQYKVQRLQSDQDIWITTLATAHRRRNGLGIVILKNFLNQHTHVSQSSTINVKPESFGKYVTDKKLSFEKIYVGNLPKWEPGKKINKGLKQLSIGNYVVPSTENSQKEQLESLKEAMERIRREKEEQQAERERKRQERLVKVEDELNAILRKCDDLERVDQKVMPLYKPVRTLVATKYFGEFLMLQEFLHSFSPILSASDVFRTNITFQQMCRAFLIREVAGPLSDILQVLISTIFALQIEESNDCKVSYVKNKKEGVLWTAANEAVDAHMFVKDFLSHQMFELPIDAQTLTEILRLHFLSSGSPTDERSQTYRYQYRNGYSVTEDPGLLLRIECPHILRAMKLYTIYQLPFKDILKILNCLVEQILTYNATITCLEERQEALYKVRNNIKMLLARENKRVQNLLNAKKTIAGQFHIDCAEHLDNPEKKADFERIMNKKLNEIEDQDLRGRGNFKYELDKMNAEMFDYLILLGTDRAYRRYYVFESLPGLFIEHDTEEVGPCLPELPKNDQKLAWHVKDRNKLKSFLLNRHRQGDKENVKKSIDRNNSLNTTPTANNGEVIKINGSATPVISIPEAAEPTALELYMCSGDLKNCIIHDPKNPSRNRWAYISTEEELNAVIDCLNPYGIRENPLRETLIKMKGNIVPHLSKCPTNILDVELADREKSISEMLSQTEKKYANSNFGFPENTDISDVMFANLTRQILEFESEITNGNLGRMKIANLEKWRSDLSANMYDSQCKKLKYGPELLNGNNKDIEAKVFRDPGENLGNTYDIESEDSSDEAISLHNSSQLQRNVSNLASALLQIEQSIERKFLKEPFGVKIELKDRNEMEAKMEAGKVRLLHWEASLMNSTSYSQIFLHFNILSDSVKWNRSSTQSCCLICRRKGDADKLLLCDNCNAGTHMFCMKPKMKKIPEGNWYCFRCQEKLGIKKDKPTKKQKKVFSMEEEEVDPKEQSEQSDASDAEVVVSKATNSRKKQQKTTTAEKKKRNSKKVVSDSDDEEVDNDEDTELGEDNTTADSSLSEEGTDDDKPLIPNGDVKKPKGKRGKQSLEILPKEMDDEEEEEEGMYIIDGDICKLCKTDETDLSCGSCKDCYHLECTGLRRLPRGIWQCSECKTQETKKRRRTTDFSSNSESDPSDDETENESRRESSAKRPRRSNSKYKDYISGSSEDITKNNNNSRRRRTGDSSTQTFNTIVLYDLLDQIVKQEDAWPFLRPVSQGEVPDYYQIIKQPMDFARIKSNLNMGRYTRNEEVLRDIQLVFKNCDTYNTQGNEIYRAGQSLERFVLMKCKEFNLKFVPSDMLADDM